MSKVEKAFVIVEDQSKEHTVTGLKIEGQLVSASIERPKDPVDEPTHSLHRFAKDRITVRWYIEEGYTVSKLSAKGDKWYSLMLSEEQVDEMLDFIEQLRQMKQGY